MSSSTNQLDQFDRVRYDPTTGTYHSECDWDDANTLSLTIIETVSAATGQEATAMEPLYSVIDPDALDSLMSTARDRTVQISFTFEGCTVSATGSGVVVVEPEK